MIELTRDSVISGLEALVEEYGYGYTYPAEDKCVYVKDGEPSCIVGKFLHAQGVPLERLSEADKENHGGGAGAGDLLLDLQSEGVISTDNIADGILIAAQGMQDLHDEWGGVVRRVKQLYPR